MGGVLLRPQTSFFTATAKIVSPTEFEHILIKLNNNISSLLITIRLHLKIFKSNTALLVTERETKCLELFIKLFPQNVNYNMFKN